MDIVWHRTLTVINFLHNLPINNKKHYDRFDTTDKTKGTIGFAMGKYLVENIFLNIILPKRQSICCVIHPLGLYLQENG